jgi:hypothetical protein
MLDDNDCVISVTQGNIFAVSRRVLLTHKASSNQNFVMNLSVIYSKSG